MKRRMQKGGALILFWLCNTCNDVSSFVDLYVALAQIIICTIIFGVLWKKMDDKYGA